jgi:hypothetical protein
MHLLRHVIPDSAAMIAATDTTPVVQDTHQQYRATLNRHYTKDVEHIFHEVWEKKNANKS